MPDKEVILLIEDEEDIRLNIRDYLEKEGYEVLLASDGVGAIKILIDSKVDIIVTDYKMDLLGGDYWIKFLSKFCKDIKTVVITGFLTPREDFPFPIVYKPFDFPELLKKIRT